MLLKKRTRLCAYSHCSCKRNIRRCYLYMCMLESIHGLDYEVRILSQCEL